MTCAEIAILWVQSITAFLIFLTLLVYLFQLLTMRKAMLHQAVKDILMEYRSSEMLMAVRTLWSFYREHPQNFVELYEEIQKQEEKANSQLPIQQRIEGERLTLHYFRRIVSQYYAMLGVLYKNKIIPKDILYSYWSEGDLRIIPNILIPIEKKLAETFDTQVDNDPSIARLQKLYDDSKQCLN